MENNRGKVSLQSQMHLPHAHFKETVVRLPALICRSSLVEVYWQNKLRRCIRKHLNIRCQFSEQRKSAVQCYLTEVQQVTLHSSGKNRILIRS